MKKTIRVIDEVWKPIKDYEGLYEVSNLGNVRSLPRNNTKGKILKQSKQTQGYKFVYLCKNGKNKKYTVHRLVAEAFIPNPNNYPNVNHKIPVNKEVCINSVDNLEWCTQSHNIKEAFRIGTAKPTWFKKYGKNHNRAKKVNQYDLDGNFIRTWDCIKEASDKLNICSSGIVMCCKNNKKYNNAGGFIWKYIN